MSVTGSAGSTNLNVLRGKIKSLSPYAVDPTLSVEGASAEAKSVGDALDKKVNTADIADNLETNESKVPLSAKQGVALNKAVKEAKAIAEQAKEAATNTDVSDIAVNKNGDEMKGDLGMGEKRLYGLADPMEEDEAVPLGYINGVPFASETEPENINDEGKVVSLYEDKALTKPLILRTKISAITDTDGVGLQTKLDDINQRFEDIANSGDNPALTIYPVGSIYMSVKSTSPASLFGGTWEQLKDRFLLGAGSTYANGATGGASTVTLTLSQIPAHTHNLVVASDYNDGSYSTNQLQPGKKVVEGADKNQNYANDNAIKNAGGSGSHNNMPPYLVVYMWKRTA